MGICGGYQMLGNQIFDEVESGLSHMCGLGLLDVDTCFEPSKKPRRWRAFQAHTSTACWLSAAINL